ncbi:DUF2244 domain-containing protein [Solimonas variicoloris]|uniref:DUF2244 domain-containing protein n=1 Tax=Solimonas variicoloris TaxID=254408 RepID=UPI00036DB259|nr:DUF2244 domain-containing protein [Solimonas variicoloris]
MSRDTQLMIGPNASLTVRQAWLFFGLMAATGLGIAGLMAARGLWPVLPFAGLELGALGAALIVSVRRNAYREVVWFTGDNVRIEFGRLGRGASTVVTLSRHWTRAELESGATRHAPMRLWLRSGGQQVEIGRCLTDEERERLQRRLQELLTPAWRSRPGTRGPSSVQGLPLGER